MSRPVRWDSDHVTILDDETKAIMEEIARCDAFDKVHIGLDFFDGSVNRIAATAIGGRSAKKAILLALLQPTEELKAAEREGNFTEAACSSGRGKSAALWPCQGKILSGMRLSAG